MSFRENLKRRRTEQGYRTAKDFAKIIGVRYLVYLKYESGEEEPKYEVLTRIANVLDTTTDELLGRCEKGANKIYTSQEMRKVERHTVYKVINVLLTEFSRFYKLSFEAKTGYEKEMWKRKTIDVINLIAKIHDKFGLDV